MRSKNTENHRWLLGLALLGLGGLLFGAASVSAQDQISLGSVTADRGVPVEIPVRIIDNKRTPLGRDRVGINNYIQAYALQVECTPTDSVAAIALVRPSRSYAESALLYEAVRNAGMKAAHIAVYSQSAKALDFSEEGQEIAMLNLTVSPSAPVGSSIECSFVPGGTMLSNQAGTVSETVATGGLTLGKGIVTVGDAPVATTVQISAIDRLAAEKKKNKGKIQITRIGDLSKKLVVKLKISGTAKPGEDYRPLKSSVAFKKGKSSITLVVKPVNDSVKERKEKVIVTVRKSKKYRLQKPSRAIVLIKDDD